MANTPKLSSVTFEILCEYALLMNNPNSMAQADIGMGRKKIPTPEEEAASKVYRLPSGQLYVPSLAFKACLLNAASGQKIGKRAARTVLAASVFEEGEVCPLYLPSSGEPIKEYEIDVRRAVVNKKCGVLRARPKIPNWACEVKFNYVTDLASPETIEAALSEGGALFGILDYRPQKLGPFGRFNVKRVS
jgi:hypothetical protein